jgi:hypothetical protein
LRENPSEKGGVVFKSGGKMLKVVLSRDELMVGLEGQI